MILDWTVFVLIAARLECLRGAATLPPASVVEPQFSIPVHNDTIGEHYKHFGSEWPDDVQLGCQELRAKRFISDGFCTSLKPIKEIVCAGQCMPMKEQNLPWWSEFTKYWANTKFKEWRCVEAVTKLRTVQLMCENGETRTYKIKIVQSCRCKSYEREPNETYDTESKTMRGKRQNIDKKRKRKEERQEEKRLGKSSQSKQDKSKIRMRHLSSEEKQRQVKVTATRQTSKTVTKAT